jgi:MFS family permease
VILAVGTLAQASTCSFLYGIPMLIPALRSDDHLSLVGASVIVSAPMVGLLLTLIAWGAAADRYGERIVISSGVGTTALLLVAAAGTHGPVALALLLVLAGAVGASVNAASGRLVMGWFPVSERGRAMGMRQTAQPVGVAIAALALPPLARAHGPHLALLFPAALCAVAAAAVVAFAVDPVRAVRGPDSPRAASPYRGSWHLGRIHLASSLLVPPQFAIATFALVYLVGERNWDVAAAGRLVFGFLIAGAAGRIASGMWSDRVGSRLTPIRQLAAMSAGLMVLLAVGASLHAVWVIAGFALAAVITVADNGLAYTAVAEFAGMEWSGRALGVQNTLQNVASIATAPILAGIIGDTRYALGFATVAIFPLLAIPLTPVRTERAADPVGGG